LRNPGMKFTGFLLLFAGWVIVLASMPLLASMKSRTAFVLAGLGVEVIGLVLVVRSHVALEDETG
jgi:hypothetical protein